MSSGIADYRTALSEYVRLKPTTSLPTFIHIDVDALATPRLMVSVLTITPILPVNPLLRLSSIKALYGVAASVDLLPHSAPINTAIADNPGKLIVTAKKAGQFSLQVIDLSSATTGKK